MLEWFCFRNCCIQIHFIYSLFWIYSNFWKLFRKIQNYFFMFPVWLCIETCLRLWCNLLWLWCALDSLWITCKFVATCFVAIYCNLHMSIMHQEFGFPISVWQKLFVRWDPVEQEGLHMSQKSAFSCWTSLSWVAWQTKHTHLPPLHYTALAPFPQAYQHCNCVWS